jgi:hypothetical protein
MSIKILHLVTYHIPTSINRHFRTLTDCMIPSISTAEIPLKDDHGPANPISH